MTRYREYGGGLGFVRSTQKRQRFGVVPIGAAPRRFVPIDSMSPSDIAQELAAMQGQPLTADQQRRQAVLRHAYNRLTE